MSWYKEWFDSPLYVKLYPWRNEEEAAQLASLISAYFSVQQYPRLLDLGCGRGRHAIRLAQMGYEVTGMDLSGNSLSEATKRAEQLNLKNITFVRGDMRVPLKARFDVVANLFTSFGYFTGDSDNVEVLSSIASMLEPGGGLVLDYMNAPLVERTYNPEERATKDDIHYDIKRYVEEDTIIKQMKLKDNYGHDHFFEERVKLYDYSWFAENLSKAGFHIDVALGSYHGEPFSSDESPRLILIAVKR